MTQTKKHLLIKENKRTPVMHAGKQPLQAIKHTKKCTEKHTVTGHATY